MNGRNSMGGHLRRLRLGILSALLLLIAAASWAAPTVTDIQPLDGSTLPVTTTATATFSETMDPATVTTGTFTVSRVVKFKAIAGGFGHTVALRKNGTVVAWGNNGQWQCDPPAGLSGVTAIAAGAYHTLALKSDGTVVAWGNNFSGEGTVPADLTEVKTISAGRTHNVALKTDGTVVAWGGNTYGESTVPPGLTDVVAISAGTGPHTLALKRDGTVVAWGNNEHGACNVPEGLSDVMAIAAGRGHSAALKADGTVITWGYGGWAAPPNLTGVISIAAGGGHYVALKSDGTVVSWGANWYGECAVPAGLSDVSAIAVGDVHSIALKNDGTVTAWGNNQSGQCTVPTNISGITAIAAGMDRYNLAVKADGTVVAWGNNNDGECDVPAGLTGVNSVAAGYQHSLALKDDGTVVGWGTNYYGQTNIPAGLSSVIGVAAGRYHSVALKSDGSVVTWGSYPGIPTGTPAGLSGITAISAAETHTVALKSDGTVVAWGSNNYGESTVPAGLSGVTAISAGRYHNLALKDDGTVAAWGYNSDGQCTVPTGLSGVTAIAAGGLHSMALKNDGTVVAWGGNTYGQSAVPTGLNGVIAIAGNQYHSVALKNDGTVVMWGIWGIIRVPTSPYEIPVEGTVSYDQVDTATFAPTAPLEFGSSYSVTVNTGTRSVWGEHLPADVSWSFATDKAPATVTIYGLYQTYDGSPKAVYATTTPAGLAVDFTYGGSATPPSNAGSYTVVATINDPYYQGTASDTLIITKAPAQFNFTGLDQTFDGTPRAVTAMTIPAGLAYELTYDGNQAAPTNAGSYTVTAAITDPNYEGNAIATLNVAKAIASINLVGLNQTYDGSSKIVTATTVPAGLSTSILYDEGATNAGSYPVDAIIIDINYEGSTSDTLVIAKAPAQFNFVGLDQVYDGTPRAVTAMTIPAGLAYDLTYDGNQAAPTNAGSYTIDGAITDPNYEGSASITLNVAKATASINLVGLNQTYDGSPKMVTATTTPAGLTVELLYDFNATSAGSYPVDAIVIDANYQGSISDTLVINKANQTITFVTEPPATLRKQDTHELVATAAVPSPVTFTVTSGPGVLNGNWLSFTANGIVVITASHPGDSNYNAAPDEQRTIIVNNK